MAHDVVRHRRQRRTEGGSVTYDMKPTRDDASAVGTSEVADATIEELEAGVRV